MITSSVRGERDPERRHTISPSFARKQNESRGKFVLCRRYNRLKQLQPSFPFLLSIFSHGKSGEKGQKNLAVSEREERRRLPLLLRKIQIF